MKNRITALILALIFVLVLLASCSGNVQTEGTNPIETTQTEGKTQTEKLETNVQTTIETDAETTVKETTQATETTEKVVTVDPNLRKYTITEDELYDKIKAGWIGEMIGVSWCAKTEFHYVHRMMEEGAMYSTYNWTPGMIANAFDQDDLYVEIPFMAAMYKYGYDCDMYYIGREYRYSSFTVWHANNAGRENLMAGLVWPETGNYASNTHADDIDWQIDADYLGMMYPGLANYASVKSFDVGHFVNYGDGVYGGVFVAAMHACAYSAQSIDEIVNAGINVIPKGTQFRDVMDAVYSSYKSGKTLEETWQMLEAKWAYDDTCSKYNTQSANIDAKLNAAYVLMGLLYGEGDFEKSIVVSATCGEDSDCNPSTVASILGNYYGMSAIEDKFTSDLDLDKRFGYTQVTLREAIDMNYSLAKDILNSNPFVVKNADGSWTISVNDNYEPVEYEQWPTGFFVNVKVTMAGNNNVTFSYKPENGVISSVTIETGDGRIFNELVAEVTYPELGEYKYKATFTSSKGETFTLEKTIHVTEHEYRVTGATPIASVSNPTGNGNKNMNVMIDGTVPVAGKADNTYSYDTNDGQPHESAYIGMTFDSAKLEEVIFVEGRHYTTGGWFADVPQIEVLVNGEWIKVESSIDKKYPDNDRKSQGDDFDVYIFKLKTGVMCEGFRITGTPGGSKTFISCGELIPVVSELGTKPKSNSDAIVTNVSYPTGSGNKNISIICDGISSGKNASDQYDTYSNVEKPEIVYIGYIFGEEKTISSITYTQGMLFDGGGWFKDGNIYIECLINGKWQKVESDASSVYPVSNAKGSFEAFKTYTIKLNNSVSCKGIRLSGNPGGSEGFISVSELGYK